MSLNYKDARKSLWKSCKTQSCKKKKFFYLGSMACQDYFTHFRPSQSLGGAKMGDPREKTHDHLACLTCDPS